MTDLEIVESGSEKRLFIRNDRFFGKNPEYIKCKKCGYDLFDVKAKGAGDTPCIAKTICSECGETDEFELDLEAFGDLMKPYLGGSPYLIEVNQGLLQTKLRKGGNDTDLEKLRDRLSKKMLSFSEIQDTVMVKSGGSFNYTILSCSLADYCFREDGSEVDLCLIYRPKADN